MSELYPYGPMAEYPPRELPELRQTIVQRLPYLKEPERNRLSFGRMLWHLTLLGLTALTTSFMGFLLANGDIGQGLLYAFALLMILGAHELGHYIACRWYDVDATLPFFIPSPLPPVGTFGAFIKIKSPIPSRRALFDIGIAGPLAGFVFAFPVAFTAHYFAEAAGPAISDGDMIVFNDPLLFKFFIKLLHLPHHLDVSPLWFAAWFGLLMTALNLMPVGQLDGGHVIYALFGARGHRLIATTMYCCVLALAFYAYATGGWLGWFVYAGLLTIMMRVGHPTVLDETEPLGLARWLVALIGLLVFVLCFMPMPISF